MVGSALVPALIGHGHNVLRLVRRTPQAADEIAWDPAAGTLAPGALEAVDAVVNLAGENVAAGRWTAARKEALLRSRVDATRTLVAAMAKMTRKPSVFVSASANGFYGDRGDEMLTETSSIGRGFLPEVCLAWETHAEGAAKRGIRTVLARFGVILAADGGALGKMLPLFRASLGGRLGNGRQWMSWITLEDVVGVIEHALRDGRCSGPINVVAPNAVTNTEFTHTLGRVLGRPAILPAPAWGLRLAFGQMADDALLASTRALPKRLAETGYVFRHPVLEPALRAVLQRPEQANQGSE
jgi:uncharacterized protein (TIGR01777 family)